jgi:hypothetical protein
MPVEEGPTEVTETTAVAGTPLARLTAEGVMLHVEPAGKLPTHVSMTVLARLLAGVTVMVAVPVWPAVMSMVGAEETAKSGVMTGTLTACAET